MTTNEILVRLKDGAEPFVTAALDELGPIVAKLAKARIGRGELAVKIEVLFGAKMHAKCEVIDESGDIACSVSLDGLVRIVVDDAKAN